MRNITLFIRLFLIVLIVSPLGFLRDVAVNLDHLVFGSARFGREGTGIAGCIRQTIRDFRYNFAGYLRIVIDLHDEDYAR